MTLRYDHFVYMSSQNSLQVSSHRARARPTLEQERFGFLLGEIEKLRVAQGKAEALFMKFRRDDAEKLGPLRDTLRASCCESVRTLDRLLDRSGWSRLDRAALEDMLRSTAEMLLESGNGDADIKAIYDKYNETSFDSLKEDELEQLKEKAEEMGFDLGDTEAIRTEDDLMERIYEEMAAREAAEESGHAKKKAKRKSAAQTRSEDNAKLARQALRDLYRKLASAVHPDRERDPARREEKNLLMQQINQAYAANDLMTLLAAQRTIEKTDSTQARSLGSARLKHYNKLLAEQLTALKNKLREMEAHFCMDIGLPPMFDITPGKLSRVIKKQARDMRAEIARQQQLLNLLADKAATKRWLKQQRRFARSDFDLEDPDVW